MTHNKVDWVAIERDFRAGVKTLRQIGEEHGVSNVAVHKRAKKEGWSRDLAERIRAKAEDLVSRRVVSANHNHDPVLEREIVEANAEVQAVVRVAHRRDIAKAREICATMFDELGLVTEHRDRIKQAFEAIGDTEEGVGQAMKALESVLSLPSRSKSMSNLAGSLSTFIRLEREAHGIDSSAGGESGVEALLRRLGEQ